MSLLSSPILDIGYPSSWFSWERGPHIDLGPNDSFWSPTLLRGTGSFLRNFFDVDDGPLMSIQLSYGG